MYCWAKARLKEEGNAYHLLRAFFNEFDPRSSIAIQGREVEAKIYFEDQPPVASVEAIGHCYVDKFVYNGELLQGSNEEELFKQTEPKVTPEKIPEQVEQSTPAAPVEETPWQAETATPAQSEEPKKRVRMACLPEIPLFEEALGSVDKTLPIDERVRLVLVAMGLETLKLREKQEVFETANLAVRLKNMRLFMLRDIMYERTSIPPMYDWDEAVMVFSTFLNKFVRKHVHREEIKVEVFLRDLQKVILDESEIQSFDDFVKAIRR